MCTKTIKKHLLLAASLTALLPQTANAQISRLGEDIEYKTELSGQFSSGDFAPLWLNANRYGLGTTNNNSGYVRAALQRDIKADNIRRWQIGYGVDLAAPFNYPSNFIVQQLYADFSFRGIVSLGVGQKERPLELKNQMLTTGGLTTGINARPLPQVRIELGPDFFVIPGTKNWLALKGHIAYGWYTDNAWQRDFNAGNTNYSYNANSLYHSKAGFIRVGNTDKFPLQLTLGFEMSSQFGGEAWNLQDRADHDNKGNWQTHQKFNSGVKAYWNAFIPGGSDSNDGDYANVEGNQLGSWHVRLDYKGKGWSAAVYGEHFFEDHSQMFWQYAWKDWLIGAELNLPKNPFVSTVLYEHLRTTDQSGPIYHDKTKNQPTPCYGVDNYYNHHIYGAWQQAGFVMGNPLIISPIYNQAQRNFGNTNNLFCYDNRVTAHHFGLSGAPCNELSWRFLFTHERSLGTYDLPREKPAYGNFLLVEASYHPHQVPGLNLTASYAQNGGELLGRSKGAMLTVSYSGWLNKKK